MENSTRSKDKESCFSEHPWISSIGINFIFAVFLILAAIFLNSLGFPRDSPFLSWLNPGIIQIITFLIVVPLVLKLPAGNKTYPEFLKDIRLGVTNFQPLIHLVILGLSTTVIALFSLAAFNIIFRLTRELPLSALFIRSLFNVKECLPPYSMGFISTAPVIFEEISCRGVFLTLFKNHYGSRTAIFITALFFGLFHVLNFLNGGNPWFVVRQIIMSCAFGLFYGYMALKTDSLLPGMIFHYLVNIFIGTFNGYIQAWGTETEMIIFLVLNLIVIVPLLIWWVKLYAKHWLADKDTFMRREKSLER